MQIIKPNNDKLSVAVLLSGREMFSPYYGGALARWTFEVYRHLNERLHLTVFGFPTPLGDRYPLVHETTAASSICRVLSQVPFVRRFEDRVWLHSLIKKLRSCDVVHIHNRPQWAFVLRDLDYRGAIVIHLQNDHLGHWEVPLLDALSEVSDAVVVCSAYLRNTFAMKSKSLAAKAHVVFNGVNLDLFRPREDIREPATILFVGRFDPEKGVLQLIEAYAKLWERHQDAKLVIAGSTGFGTHERTDYVERVERAARSVEYRGAKIQFAGYVHHDRDLPMWFQRATIFVCPSLFQEPFGLVNAEAMACATPAVGSDRGGIPEVLGPQGCLVDPEDIGAFSEVLGELLTDPKRRLELGRLGLDRAAHLFDWRLIAEHWLDLLRGIGVSGPVSNTRGPN